MNIIIVLNSLIIGILRILGERDEIYQAVAHIWITFLICRWWYENKENPLLFAILLIIIEIICGVFGIHYNYIH